MQTEHDAFISYDHDADRALAKALEEGMEKLAKPLLALRAVDVFRDETSLAANPDLWAGIVDHLTGAKWLVLLASPEWADSHWCRREVLWWLENRSIDRILVVWVGGDLAWDKARSDFDWSVTTALSRDLSGRFREVPLYVDLRWARGQDGLTLRNLGFRNAVLDLSATIRGVRKDQLDGADVRQLRRNRRLVRSGVAAITVFAVAAVWQAIVATQQRDEAVRQARIARSRELAAASRLERSNPDLSIFLAARALRASPTSEALAAARDAMLASPLRTILAGHSGALTDATFSPDGRLALTASIDKTARLWDSSTGDLVRDLAGHSAGINRVAFSPKGTYIVTASEDGTARIWSSTSGDVVCPALRHSRAVRDAEFAADETRVLTGSLDGTAAVWDVQSCSRSASLAHPRGVARVSFSADGRKILTAGFDDNTRIWKADDSTLLATLRQRDSHFAVFSPDGSKVVTAGLDGSPRVWDVSGSAPVAKPLGEPSSGGMRASFSPDGKHIVIAGVRPAARIWNAERGELEAEWFEMPEAVDPSDAANVGVADAVFSPDGGRVLTRFGTTLRVWDVGSGRRIALFKGHTRSLQAASFSPDGTRVISASFDGTARIWQVSEARTVARLADLGGRLEHALFSPDGRSIAGAAAENGVRLWQLDDPEHSRTLRSGSRAFQTVSFSSDMKRIAAQTTPYAQVWSVATGEPLSTLRPSVIVDAVSFPQLGPDGTRIIAGSATAARIWNVDTGTAELELRGHTDAVTHAAFRADGKQAVTGSKDGTARVWDTASGESVATLSGHSEPVSFVGYSSDGRRVVTASWDYTARVWDAASGQPLAVLTGHSRPLTYARFSPTGQWIVTLGHDQTARIWDATIGQEVARFWSSAEPILATTFVPDSDRITVLTASGKLVEVACELCATTDSLLALATRRVFRQPTPDEVKRYHLDGD